MPKMSLQMLRIAAMPFFGSKNDSLRIANTTESKTLLAQPVVRRSLHNTWRGATATVCQIPDDSWLGRWLRTSAIGRGVAEGAHWLALALLLAVQLPLLVLVAIYPPLADRLCRFLRLGRRRVCSEHEARDAVYQRVSLVVVDAQHAPWLEVALHSTITARHET